ncbi:MAG TPA: ester cyclase [Candidatus Polarisedimenticolia bacterium]|nr:ester cyclase [Candidatus Polarisedimenticolia bacterium]
MITEIRTETNKVIARRFIEEVFEKGDDDAIDELVADDFTPHNWSTDATGRAAVRDAVKRASAGLSNARITVDDVIGEDDKVVVRVTSQATQTGDFMGLPPSGKTYRIEEIHIFRLKGGKVVEHWHQGDWLGMMRQLGALPGPDRHS